VLDEGQEGGGRLPLVGEGVGCPRAGAGLGLSIVRELVEAHGGSVRYEAEANAFVVVLPAAPPPAQRRGAERPRAVTAAAAP